MFADAQVIKNLTFHTSWSVDQISSIQTVFNPPYEVTGGQASQTPESSTLATQNRNAFTWFTDDYFTYQNTFGGKQHLTATLGYSAQLTTNKNYNASVQNFMSASRPYLSAGINRANVAIERIGAIPSPGKIGDQPKKRLIAEARFLRGLYYFYLVRLFGEVPLVLQTSSDPSAPGVAKSPESGVYAQVETDFKAAIPDLPATYSAANLGRATSGAAKSFLAQMHMWRNEAAKAIPLLEEVIASKQYALESKFIDLFLESNVNSREMVFAIQYKDLGSSAESASWVRSIGVRGQRPVVNQSGFGFMVGTKELLENYEVGDLRRDLSFWEFGEPNPANPSGTKYNAKNSSPFHLNTTDVGPQKWWWARQGYFQETAANLGLIRYADVLLLYAEALNEANNGPTKAALDAIDAVRSRAGVKLLAEGLTKTAFFEAVMCERRTEFVFEFQRWWDLARTKTAERFFANSVYKMGKFNAKHYKWPLPQNALDRNKALVQNPNY